MVMVMRLMWNKTHVVDLVEGNITSVLDVLLLLSVPCGFYMSVASWLYRIGAKVYGLAPSGL